MSRDTEFIEEASNRGIKWHTFFWGCAITPVVKVIQKLK